MQFNTSAPLCCGFVQSPIQTNLAIRILLILLIDVTAIASPAWATWEKSVFYTDENFEPLLAATKEPQFLGSIQHLVADKPLNIANAGLVGLGENFGLMQWQERRSGDIWELGITSGLFALFDLKEKATDLVNSDFLVGLDAVYRGANTSCRTRLMHQSSHLGDEFLIKNNDVERLNYSFEFLDLTVSRVWGRWRAYGGGGYVVRSKPNITRPKTHTGVEFHGARHPWLGARLRAGFHSDFDELYNWEPNVKALVGLEFGRLTSSTHRLGIRLEAYDGYSPWGQFYEMKVRSFGSTIYFEL